MPPLNTDKDTTISSADAMAAPSPNRASADSAAVDRPLDGHDSAPTNRPALLEAQALTLQHANGAGVAELSLSLHRGDILGLLGLNGAGKSTTLRLLCGILQPDRGQVVIDGLSLAEYPLQARARIGYLPDQPPLYDEMRVCEYLRLCARIRGLERPRARQRVTRIIEQCDLGDVRRSLIRTLSKGYRQRIGLAQALIHEPAVILLDEPANGLDPQQMDNMRQLIRDLGKEQAVLFSTHLLSEVTATCNRVAIVSQGHKVADQTVDQAADGKSLEELFRNHVS